jgi:hypothetical protein
VDHTLSLHDLFRSVLMFKYFPTCAPNNNNETSVIVLFFYPYTASLKKPGIPMINARTF